MKKKHPLTLIEVIIALSLMGLVLTFLWQALFGVQKMLLKEEKAGVMCIDKALFYTKLSQLFLNLSKDPSSLYTANDEGRYCLVIHAMHPVEVQKEFSGMLKSWLFEDSGHIALSTLASSEKEKMTDLFFSYVESLSFSFYDEKAPSWVSEWPKEKKKIPTMIRINYTADKEEEELIFHPQHDIEPIIFPKNKQ
jgi:hypothetical protein